MAENKGYTKIFDTPELSYAFYDISNNGTKELIIAGNGSIAAVYALIKGNPKLIFQTTPKQTYIKQSFL